MNFKVIIGCILLGLLTIVVGYLSVHIVKRFSKTSVPIECKNWNKNHVMEISLFITGVIIGVISYGFSKYQIKSK